MKKLLKECLYILFVVTVLFFLSEQPSLSGTVKFAQLSDIHYSTTRDDTSYKLLSKTKPLLKDAIHQINNEKNIDFVMLTGDIVDIPSEKSFLDATEVLKTINYPFYFVLGNHDITNTGDFTKEKLLKILKEKNPKNTFDKTYYTFKHKGNFRIIVLDGVRNEKFNSAKGEISKEQLVWLDKILSKSKKDVVLIFIHFPLFAPYDSPNHEIINKKEFKAVLEKYNMPIGIFSGHYHTTKIRKMGNILHVSTPALATYPHAFRVVEVENKRNKAIFNFKYMETNLKDLQAKTKILTLGGTKFYGLERDRNTTVIIKKN